MNRVFKIGRKNIGTFHSGDNIFRKDVQKSKHLFRVLDAWGMDSKTLQSLYNDTRIIITDVESGDVYECLKSDYNEKGLYYHFKNQLIDHRTQKFLRRKEFKKTELSEDEKAKREYYIQQGLPL